MLERNRDRIDLLKYVLNDPPPAEQFFQTVPLECDISAPLGWSLTKNDRLSLDASMKRKDAEFLKIHEIILGNIPKAASH